MWSGAILLVCIAAGVLISTVFAGATVTVSPRTETVTPPGAITAFLTAPSNGLAYKIVSVTKSSTTTVPATGTKTVSRQASGVVTISNSFSTTPQRLIANTRFAAPDGKIYRIRDSVTVPGMSGVTPGTTMATLYADSPGDTYNRSGVTTFTIPGFKGDPRYDKFSAVSQGAITGGFIGTEPSVADADLSKAKAELGQTLTAAVNAGAASVIPDGYVAVPGTLKVVLGDVAVAPATDGSAAVVESATATGAVVAISDLAAAIARGSIKDYTGASVTLDPASQMTVAAASSTDLALGTLLLGLSGTAVIVWQFDPAAVKEGLLGKPKGQFEDILKSFAPALRCSAQAPCEASIRPFWQSSFPSNPDKITLVVRLLK